MFGGMGTGDLLETYQSLGGLARAVEAQRLAVLGELARRQAFRIDGCLNAAQWVAATDMVTTSTARAMASIAEALPSLPAVQAVVNEGGFSLEQLAPLVELADPASDAEWAERAPAMTPAALEALAKQRRRVGREQAQRQHGRRTLRWWNAPHGLGVRFAGLLPHEAAAVVTDRLTAMAEEAGPSDDGMWEPFPSRCADALVALASSSAQEAGHADVVVQVPVGVEALQPTLGDGTVISIDTMRRLACDATAHLLVENLDGSVAGYGRRRRIVPDKMRQRLRRRDRHCAWNGCTNTRGLHAHHIKHWLDGGGTDEGNLILLCARHHRLLHEEGWHVERDPISGAITFTRPGGGSLARAPARVPDELRKRYSLDAA
jgi:hypothetical protein